MNQMGFSELEFAAKKKRTRRERSLDQIEGERPAILGFLAYSAGAGIFKSSGASRCGSSVSKPSGVVTISLMVTLPQWAWRQDHPRKRAP